MAQLKSTTISGDLTVNGDLIISGGNLYLPSDMRIKENICNINTPFLNRISNINVKTFNYTYDSNKKPQIGIIAQDLEKNFPEFTNELIMIDDDTKNTGIKDRRYISEDKLIFILWKSIQELNEKINMLETEIKVLMGDK